MNELGIRFNLKKSVQDNAADYYDLGKKARKKSEGVEAALEETERKIKRAKKKQRVKEERKENIEVPKVRVVREREWYEGFGWSFTDSGKLLLFGRNSKQNDLVVARHLDEKDLFFHADIKGGSAVILKGERMGSKEVVGEIDGEENGLDGGLGGISDEDKQVAARLAVSFSSAWGKGFSQADTYCVSKEQVGKHASGGYVGAGGFAILGKREWFRNTPLKVVVGLDEKGRVGVGAPGAKWINKGILLVPGKKAKGETGKELAKILGVHESEVIHVLPSGNFSIVTE